MSDLESVRLRWGPDSAGWPNATCSRIVRAHGLSWHVQIAGEGPDLLLLHGAGGSDHSWAEMLPSLSREYRVIAPDLPGHAFTTALPADRSTLPDVATAVTDLMDAVGASPTGIVTHSAGAAVAMFLIQEGVLRPRVWAAMAPSLVRPSRGTPPPVIQDLLAPVFRTTGLAFLSAAIGGRKRIADALLASTGSRVPPASRDIYRRLVGNPAHVGSVLRLMAAWDPEPVTRRLDGVHVPGLVVAGDEDGWIPPRDVREAVDRLPEVTLRVLPGRGHLLHEEVPGQVLEMLLPFLRRHATEGDEAGTASRD
ncbi:MAG: alpha/beta fold hydrolase [Gemmatimonadota bacterium]|jgi:magnesium chelatase accessory protein